MIGTEMYKTRIGAPEKKPRGIYSPYLEQFMKTENLSMKFNCSSEEEAKKCYAALMNRNREKNLNLTIWKKGSAVYAIKG